VHIMTALILQLVQTSVCGNQSNTVDDSKVIFGEIHEKLAQGTRDAIDDEDLDLQVERVNNLDSK
jgi:hypothetical protein